MDALRSFLLVTLAASTVGSAACFAVANGGRRNRATKASRPSREPPMKVRSHAEFTSSLPDDIIEDPTGKYFIQFGGKSVAVAIGELLEKLGCEVEPPADAGEHGWDFGVQKQGCHCWCQITLIERYLFSFEPRPVAFALPKPPPPIYLELLRGLGRELAADPRFSDVEWYYPEEAVQDLPGAAQPFDD